MLLLTGTALYASENNNNRALSIRQEIAIRTLTNSTLSTSPNSQLIKFALYDEMSRELSGQPIEPVMSKSGNLKSTRQVHKENT